MASIAEIRDRWLELNHQRRSAITKMERTLRPLVGREVRFRSGNMRSAARAKVLSVPFGGQDLNVENLETGKTRAIDPGDLVTADQ